MRFYHPATRGDDPFSFSLHVEAIPTEWTTKWYTLNSADIVSSIIHSLEISLPAVAIALLVAMPLSFAMARWDFAGKRLINQMILLPMLLPGTALGLPWWSCTSPARCHGSLLWPF